jgi:hypothetical protein
MCNSNNWTATLQPFAEPPSSFAIFKAMVYHFCTGLRGENDRGNYSGKDRFNAPSG